MHIEVSWPVKATLHPQVVIQVDFGQFEDGIDMTVDLGRAYAFYDATVAADRAGTAPPDPIDILRPAQVRTLEALAKDWPTVTRAIAAMYPHRLRPHLCWSGLRLSARERSGLAYVELSGHISSLAIDEYAEHGIGAVLLGPEPIAVGERGLSCPMPGPDPAPRAPRPHPAYRALEEPEIRRLVAANEWAELRRRHRETGRDAAELVDALLLDEILSADSAAEAKQMSEAFRDLMRSSSSPVRDSMLRANPEVVRVLIRAGRYHVPPGVLHEEEDPERVRRWVRLGAAVNRVRHVGGVPEAPLVAQVDRPAVFTALLELGADPGCLRDAYGITLVKIGPEQRAALLKFHPDFFAEAERRPEVEPGAQGRALATWLERGWLSLTGEVPEALLDAAIDRLMTSGTDAETLIARLLALPGIDEVYASDDEVEELLRDW